MTGCCPNGTVMRCQNRRPFEQYRVARCPGVSIVERTIRVTSKKHGPLWRANDRVMSDIRYRCNGRPMGTRIGAHIKCEMLLIVTLCKVSCRASTCGNEPQTAR